MKKTNLLAALLLATPMISLQASAGEFLVKYKNSSAYNLVWNMSDTKAFKVLSTHDVGNLMKIDIPKMQEPYVIAKLLNNQNIEYVVPNFKLKALRAPLDIAALKEQWAIAKVNAEKAWQRAGNKGNKNVLVAVIDTGVDYRHPALAANMVQGFNFKDNNSDPMDKTGMQNPGHGTHCAGVIGATGLVDGGTVGISPEVSIMPLRFLGEDGSGDLESGIKAIDYAIEKGVQVISASWGANVPESTARPLIEAIKRADDKGVIFVAAAGNDGKNNDGTPTYPANSGLPNTITVAASGSSDAKPSWSNYGTATVHLASPGENIISTLPGNKYGDLSGTSMATPLVAGLVAFLKAQDPSLTGAQVRALLQTTGAKVSIQTACNCRIDAFAAVDSLLSKKMVVVPAATTVKPNDKVAINTLFGKAPFKYESSNASAMTVDASGNATAVADGKTTIKVTDADGNTATSLDYNVSSNSGGGGDDGGGTPGNPGAPGECPLGDKQLCDIACQVMPTLPFCQK